MRYAIRMKYEEHCLSELFSHCTNVGGEVQAIPAINYEGKWFVKPKLYTSENRALQGVKAIDRKVWFPYELSVEEFNEK